MRSKIHNKRPRARVVELKTIEKIFTPAENTATRNRDTRSSVRKIARQNHCFPHASRSGRRHSPAFGVWKPKRKIVFDPARRTQFLASTKRVTASPGSACTEIESILRLGLGTRFDAFLPTAATAIAVTPRHTSKPYHTSLPRTAPPDNSTNILVIRFEQKRFKFIRVHWTERSKDGFENHQ